MNFLCLKVSLIKFIVLCVTRMGYFWETMIYSHTQHFKLHYPGVKYPETWRFNRKYARRMLVFSN